MGDIVGVDELHLSATSPLARELTPGAVVENAVPASSVAQPDWQKTENMRDLEREHILETLASVGGSRKLTGERLGMSERTLRYKLKQYREAGLFDE